MDRLKKQFVNQCLYLFDTIVTAIMFSNNRISVEQNEEYRKIGQERVDKAPQKRKE